VSPEWLYFLAEEQNSIFESIFDQIINEISGDGGKSRHIIMGGPGTGKTCILLNLLKYFVDYAEYQIGIDIADHVVSYIEATTQTNIAQFVARPPYASQLDVLLVDDPAQLAQTLALASTTSMTTVVAFDPLQLQDSITDADLTNALSTYDAQPHFLHACYRQKENVGKTTKNVVDVIAASTPFLDQGKIKSFRAQRQELTELSNQLRFMNPLGYSNYYSTATVEDLRFEVNRILSNEWLMWKHWPGLLILLDECELSEESNDVLEPLIRREYVRILPFDQVQQIKGLEFQHVFVFIKQTLFDQLQSGFSGSGQKIYNQRRLLRIPFSRAKDSLVVFAMS
jgi:hypothetical protein